MVKLIYNIVYRRTGISGINITPSILSNVIIQSTLPSGSCIWSKGKVVELKLKFTTINKIPEGGAI